MTKVLNKLIGLILGVVWLGVSAPVFAADSVNLSTTVLSAPTINDFDFSFNNSEPQNRGQVSGVSDNDSVFIGPFNTWELLPNPFLNSILVKELCILQYNIIFNFDNYRN